MMRRWIPLLLVAVSGIGGSIRSPARAAPAVVWWSLEDSTRCALLEDHRVPVTGLRIMFPAGNRSTWVRRTHAREAFEAQAHDPQRRLLGRADDLSADLTLNMAAHEAELTVTCATEDLAAVVALVRDVLANRDYDREELKRRETQDALAWKESQSDPSDVGDRAAYRLFYVDGDSRRYRCMPPPRIATDAARLAAARDTLVRLPGRCIGFWGDLTEGEARELVRGLLPPPLTRPPSDLDERLDDPVPEAALGPTRNERLPKLTQVHITAARLWPSYRDAAQPSLAIAEHAFSGHFHARLQRALRHETSWVYGVSSRIIDRIVPDLYFIATSCSPDHAGEAEARLRETIEGFREKGITEEERSLAADALSGRLAVQSQSPADVLRWAVWERIHGFPPGFRRRLIEQAGREPLDHINQVIAEFYDPDRFHIVKVSSREGEKISR